MQVHQVTLHCTSYSFNRLQLYGIDLEIQARVLYLLFHYCQIRLRLLAPYRNQGQRSKHWVVKAL